VVILGLIGLSIANSIHGLAWMYKADSVAAQVVAVIVIYVSAELGWRTISALLDTAPRGLAEKIEMVAASVPGVVDAHAIRIRPSGAHIFIDMHVTMDGSVTLKEAHAATEVIENAILKEISPADVTVHVEPAGIPKKIQEEPETETKAPNLKIKQAGEYSPQPASLFTLNLAAAPILPAKYPSHAEYAGTRCPAAPLWPVRREDFRV
jgi:divalent metal cation (Fe/Co/Zn/Cd) transporter